MISEGLTVPEACVSGFGGHFSVSENRGVLASGHPGKEIERNVTKSGSPCFPFPFPWVVQN